MEFPYKVGQTVTMALSDDMSDVSVKITACADNHLLEGEFIVMGELTEMDTYVVFSYDESAFSVKIHQDDEMSVFDYIERAFGVSV